MDSSHQTSVGYTDEQRERLQKIIETILSSSFDTDHTIPTVPCISTDRTMIALTAVASRIRFGQSVTFIMSYYADVRDRSLKNETTLGPPIARRMFWAIFDDGSISLCYGYDADGDLGRASFLECPLSSFAQNQLWNERNALRVHLVQLSNQSDYEILFKAFVTVPMPITRQPDDKMHHLTLCTPPIHNTAKYLPEWIEFHRSVGFRRIVIYNSTDESGDLDKIVNEFRETYPNLVEVQQWNFSGASIRSSNDKRTFEFEAVHDCLLRFGDQSEWIGVVDINEYITPMSPYKTVQDYLLNQVDVGWLERVKLSTDFYCRFSSKANVSFARLTGNKFHKYFRETFTLYNHLFTKYLYRPRFILYLNTKSERWRLQLTMTIKDHIFLRHIVFENGKNWNKACS